MHQLSGRKSKLFAAVLALVVNAAGGPMTWARAMNSDAGTDASAQGMEHCSGGTSSNSEEPGNEPAGDGSCCSGGSCTCGCLPAALAARVTLVRTFLSPAAEVTTVIHSVPVEPLEDPLRPPIH
jgi:hypothetical protein